MPHANLKTIYVTAAVHEVIRQAALQRQMDGEDCSMGDIVAEACSTPARRQSAPPTNSPPRCATPRRAIDHDKHAICQCRF